jgi:N-acetylglucosamine-6-phosphate deacetylase
MSMERTALAGARIFDGEHWHERSALVVEDGRIVAIVPEADTGDAALLDLGGGLLAPGFVDLQVNGAGGVQFNDAPAVEAIRTICATFARYGTTGLLVTLITDTPEITAAALAAGEAAAAEGVPGFLGLHLEGPHLDPRRKGAHDPRLIRPMDEADLEALVAAAGTLPALLCTVAPESVTPQQVARLSGAGAVVSIGHTDAGYASVAAAAAAGAHMVTHLFNAQSQLAGREPGVVGAALDLGVHAGLIADGIHVDPVSIGIALRAKRGPGRILLVTDAMALAGSDRPDFYLNGRRIHRDGGALRLDDGTLAGADLTMDNAVAFMHRRIGLKLGEALRMASLYPSEAMGFLDRGRLAPGTRADVVHMSEELKVRGTWIGGEKVWSE